MKSVRLLQLPSKLCIITAYLQKMAEQRPGATGYLPKIMHPSAVAWCRAVLAPLTPSVHLSAYESRVAMERYQVEWESLVDTGWHWLRASTWTNGHQAMLTTAETRNHPGHTVAWNQWCQPPVMLESSDHLRSSRLETNHWRLHPSCSRCLSRPRQAQHPLQHWNTTVLHTPTLSELSTAAAAAHPNETAPFFRACHTDGWHAWPVQSPVQFMGCPWTEGAAQDNYVTPGYGRWNQYDFNFTPKSVIVTSNVLIVQCTGRLFQTRGLATAKLQMPNVSVTSCLSSTVTADNYFLCFPLVTGQFIFGLFVHFSSEWEDLTS